MFFSDSDDEKFASVAVSGDYILSQGYQRTVEKKNDLPSHLSTQKLENVSNDTQTCSSKKKKKRKKDKHLKESDIEEEDTKVEQIDKSDKCCRKKKKKKHKLAKKSDVEESDSENGSGKSGTIMNKSEKITDSNGSHKKCKKKKHTI